MTFDGKESQAIRTIFYLTVDYSKKLEEEEEGSGETKESMSPQASNVDRYPEKAKAFAMGAFGASTSVDLGETMAAEALEHLERTMYFCLGIGWVNKYITTENFPTERSGIVELEGTLVPCDERTKFDEIPARLAKLGLRVSTVQEQRAFGARYPEEQMKYPVASGSVVMMGGMEHFPVLYRVRKERHFELFPCNSGYSKGERILSFPLA